MVGRTRTINTLENAFSLGTNYLSKHGFTMSVEDLNVNEKVRKQTAEIIEDAEKETEAIIESYKNGKLDIIPGKTLEENKRDKNTSDT